MKTLFLIYENCDNFNDFLLDAVWLMIYSSWNALHTKMDSIILTYKAASIFDEYLILFNFILFFTNFLYSNYLLSNVENES